MCSFKCTDGFGSDKLGVKQNLNTNLLVSEDKQQCTESFFKRVKLFPVVVALLLSELMLGFSVLNPWGKVITDRCTFLLHKSITCLFIGPVASDHI